MYHLLECPIKMSPSPMGRPWLVASSLVLCILALGPAGAMYYRPAAKQPLPLNHQQLVRRSDSPHEPEQVHLALAGAGAVAVSWVTNPQEEAFAEVAKSHHKDACQRLASAELQSMVRYGTAPGNYSANATGGFACYGADEYVSGALHTVLLGLGEEGPLAPDTEIFYVCGDAGTSVWSREFSFRTQPKLGLSSLPYRLGLVGDLGQTEDSLTTLQHLAALKPASVLNVGDLSYADGYQPRWDSWGRLLEAHAARVPWMHIEGNHEEEVTDGHEGFLAYESRFYFPAEESRSGSPFYYSYEVAGAHVVMLGCYVEYGTDSDQYAWLRADLATIDRQRTPWLIVGMHAPWYNSNEAHQGEVEDMLEAMEPLLSEYGTDMVFAGHVHAYERSHRVLGGERNECGALHIVIGDGGNREGLSPDYLQPQPDWSASREASFGCGLLLLQNETHAVWQWHRNNDDQFEVAEEVVIERTSKCTAALEARLQKQQGGVSELPYNNMAAAHVHQS